LREGKWKGKRGKNGRERGKEKGKIGKGEGKGEMVPPLFSPK